jgi:hypothetical protein
MYIIPRRVGLGVFKQYQAVVDSDNKFVGFVTGTDEERKAKVRKRRLKLYGGIL